MNAARKLPGHPPLTWLEYEATEARSAVRHEFVDGAIFAMAGGTEDHNRIAGAIYAEIYGQLRGKPCEPFISDMKLKVSLGKKDLGYYPDVMVVCDPKGIHGTHVTRPAVIFEVLSDSTATVDLREKRLIYQSIRSLEVYVVVNQAKAEITVFRRSHHWVGETLTGLKAALLLPEIGVRLPLPAIYHRASWRRK